MSTAQGMAAAAGQNVRSRAAAMVAEPWLLLAALLLAGIGVIMVYSASSALAEKRHLDAAAFAKSQFLHVCVGLAVMALLTRLDYIRLRPWVYPGLILVFVALCLVFLPGIGHRAGGAARWLRLGSSLSVQPAELAKLALVLFLAHWLADNQHRVKSFFMVFLPCLGVAGVLTAPVLLEPDLGASVTLVVLAAGMLAVAGTRLGYLVALLLACLPPLYFLVITVPYRLRRLKFWDPWSDPTDTGFQLIHSFFALGTGGFLGAGLGGSRQKLFYLPEPHTDFILSVLGEEFGFWGVSLVLGLFMLLIWRGVRVALSARDLFGTYLALGATMVIGLQAFVNAGVVMGLLPTKGLTLPFISYGGSSLVVNFACVGLLLSVARHQERPA